METSYIYWKHELPCGVVVEEITGREDKSGKVWLAMARQIWMENGKDGAYQVLDHTDGGAPLLSGENRRVSVTHTDRMLAVATLPETTDADLTRFTEEAILGIDCERVDRSQVLKVRERFLSENELAMIDAEDVTQNVLAWTIKEAALKAALRRDIDIRKEIEILTLPNPKNGAAGEARVTLADGTTHTLTLHSYISDGQYLITIALRPHPTKTCPVAF